MKSLLISSLLVLVTSSAFAKPTVRVLCHSLQGAKKVALVTVESSKADASPFARITIQGIGGEISSMVPNNDETFSFDNDPINGKFSASGDISSDDGRYTSISYEQIPGTVKLAPSSTADQGAADFAVKISSALTTISHVSTEVKAQQLLCHAQWTTKK